MTSIAINALPPMVSALFLFSLAVTVLFSSIRHWMVYVFSGFCIVMGLSSTFGFLIETVADSRAIAIHVRLEYFFTFTALSFANMYGIGLTEFRFGDRRRHQLVMTSIFSAVVVVWLVVLFMLFFTDWLFEHIERLDNYGLQVKYGPAMWVLLGIYFIGTTRNLFFFIQSYRKQTDPILREFIWLNMIAFHTIFAPAIWLLFVLPVFGLTTQVLAFLAFPVAVLMFNIATIRFNNARLSELNVSLEQKVEARSEQLKSTQARLAESERMASLGQLVAGVAHEMNNPVGAVKGMAATVASAAGKLRDQTAAETIDRDRIDQITGILEDAGQVIHDGTKKITAVVDNLKSFARLDAAEMELIDLNPELEETVRLLENVLKPGVTISLDLSPLPKILCYPARLNQVFLNLIMNANEAIAKEGTIIIRTRADDSWVKIDIQDTGRGIPPDIIEKVFEPGFTTKGAGVGTGLGLAICYQIIRDHEGEISIHSGADTGTQVRLQLPRSRRKPQ